MLYSSPIFEYWTKRLLIEKLNDENYHISNCKWSNAENHIIKNEIDEIFP